MKKWYMLQTIVGREKGAALQLKEELELNPEKKDLFGEIFVPIQKEWKSKGGKRVQVDSVVFKGYIAVEMENLAENRALSNIVLKPKSIKGFVSETPVSVTEINKMKAKLSSGSYVEDKNLGIKEGDTVAISEGAFSSFQGVVSEVKDGKLKIIVKVFGRETPVEVPTDGVKVLAQ